jgi:hypothetical protein
MWVPLIANVAKLGVAFETTHKAVTDADVWLAVSACVAVIVTDPAPIIVQIDPKIEMTLVSDDAYDHNPTLLLVGFTKTKSASPNVLLETTKGPNVGGDCDNTTNIAVVVAEL